MMENIGKTGAVLVAGLLVVMGVPLASAGSELTVVVPAGTTLEVFGPVVADAIIVHGSIVQAVPGDLVLEAQRIELADGSLLRGHDGAQGSSALGVVAYGTDGSKGGGILLRADSISVAAQAVIQSGSGGGGGSTHGAHISQAGSGGHGGSIHFTTDDLRLDGIVLPGAGGHGGHAYSFGNAVDVDAGYVAGGDGGDSGFVFINDTLAPMMMPATRAPSTTLPSPPLLCFKDGLSDNTPTRRPGTDASAMDLKTALKDQEDRDLKPQQCSGGGGEPSTPGDPDPGQLVPDLPGAPGAGDTGSCIVQHGNDGQDNFLGDGGDGGNGCSRGQGKSGTNGSNGRDDPFGCTAGGNGGPGAMGQSFSASGGNGGQGQRNGGDGGSATSIGTGGTGGNGGNGGQAHIGPDCAGGHGGPGGSGTSGTAAAGHGGNGICGSGGRGGDPVSEGIGGSGGAGGAGNPAGLPGTPGSGTSGSAIPANGGSGPGVC